jgi:triosephosphate isomerase
MAQRTPFVGGNWKMNTDLADGDALARAVAEGGKGLFEACDVVVCPPLPYLQSIGKSIEGSGLKLGAQNVYHEANGAFTGEVSCSMLNDLGVQVVLVGHSERRHVIGEGDLLINAKLRAALDAGLHVILCIGETIQQREAGQTDAVNAGQLAYGLAGVTPQKMAEVTIAYEPVWAIGTGKTATPDDAQAAHKAIREWLAFAYDRSVADAVRIQYGGSVKPDNAAELFSQPDIDGGLIGGASLKADDFIAIVRAAVETRVEAAV